MPVTVVENGSKKVATTGDRLPRMRCIGSRRRCCINRARSVDVYAQRSRGQPLSSQIPEQLLNF
ncbi:MAG: hypothetical protein VB140_09795 [Burkholderia sp.]